METTGSALLLATGSPVDVAPVFGSWTCHLSSCPLPYLDFGAAREGKLDLPIRHFPQDCCLSLVPGGEGRMEMKFLLVTFF